MENKLQLLVIDFGDACVIRIENGQPRGFNIEVDGRWHTLTDGPTVILHPLAKLREAIDGEKPVPRIEATDNGRYDLQFRTYMGDSHKSFTPEAFNALSQLAGKPLPVWKGGKWTGLPETSEYISDPLDDTGVKIWRYTR